MRIPLKDANSGSDADDMIEREPELRLHQLTNKETGLNLPLNSLPNVRMQRRATLGPQRKARVGLTGVVRGRHGRARGRWGETHSDKWRRKFCTHGKAQKCRTPASCSSGSHPHHRRRPLPLLLYGSRSPRPTISHHAPNHTPSPTNSSPLIRTSQPLSRILAA